MPQGKRAVLYVEVGVDEAWYRDVPNLDHSFSLPLLLAEVDDPVPVDPDVEELDID